MVGVYHRDPEVMNVNESVLQLYGLLELRGADKLCEELSASKDGKGRDLHSILHF